MRQPAANAAPLIDTPAPPRMGDDLRGLVQLLVRGVKATTDLAEGVHASIPGLHDLLPGRADPGATRGIPRLAYQGVRMVAGVVGAGVDEALARATPLLGQDTASDRREALVAVLNGVLGDHLLASGNPLALQAALRLDGQPLLLDGETWPKLVKPLAPRLLVQVHGLCMNHLQWRQGGHDHGEQLALALGYTPVHLHYNSGLSIASNGQAFADLLQRLVDAWPMPIERFAILGHSMGGLVARAAIAAATRQRQAWVTQLDQIVFLGTPHQGAPLERAGKALEATLGMTPWTAPFVRLGQLRSAGIQDLRHGLVEPAAGDGPRRQVQVPGHIRAYAVAGSTQATRSGVDKRLPGDGLVPVRSAFGQHRDPRRALRIPPAHRFLAERTGHIELLGSPAVQARLQEWLA